MKLRSQNWFGGTSLFSFIHRSWMKNQGFGHHVFEGRPVIGICNSFSELTPCNAHLRTVAEAVKRGVWQAGGFPVEFPTISLGEILVKPSTLMYRNLMAMDVEEMIRANPVDAVVLLCGCDKTTPAQLMGACSADVPALVVPGGPMLSGYWNGQKIGSGTDAFRFWDMYRTGEVTEAEFTEIESCMSRSPGHCMTMGTASTMTSLAEALGMTLPGAASIPAVDSRRMALAEQTGWMAVQAVEQDLRPSKVLNRKSFENAIRVLMALGGSTNGVIHLIAIARRLGIDIRLEDFDHFSRTTPVVTNVEPSGQYLMEDFFYAGGVPAVMKEIEHLLHGDALTVNGKTVRENLADVKTMNRDVIRSRDNPLSSEGGVAVLFGNLAPNGAVIKLSAASPHLLRHTGRAVVFENRDELLARIDDPNLEVDKDSVLVLKNAGPKGGPGMPEWGQMPIPKKLLAQGVKDMVRISDARMSGTSYGTVVLHVAPESAVGGPLALVENDDLIELDAAGRRLTLHVDEAELQRRRSQWQAPEPHYRRGYGHLFLERVLQADEGCDFDFLLPHPDDVDEDDLPARYARLGHS